MSNQMDKFGKFKKTIIGQILVTAAVVAAAVLVLGYKAEAKGFVLGSLFSLVNFILMVRQTPGRLGRSRNQAIGHSFLGLALPLGLMALPLIAAMLLAEIDVIWTAIGLFNLQFSIIINGFLAGRPGPDGGTSGLGR